MENHKIRIRPPEIEIPERDPFENDLLGRRGSVQILTRLLQNLESPYTMSIDSSWGNGKTTFLNMWKQHLRNEGFPVVSFNAWETDFTGSPLVALTSELIEELKRLDDNDDLGIKALETRIPKILRVALTRAVPGLISLVGGVVSIQTGDPSVGLAATTLSSGLSFAMEETTKAEPPNDSPEPTTYLDAKSAIIDFRAELRNTAWALSCKHDNRPLVVAIDELDRCRPPYAVELLEIAKHFFSIENIVFVLAIDKSQLAHAIKSLYGNEFDSIGYLRRFIDLDFHLPDFNRTSFIAQLMNETEMLDLLKKNPSYSLNEAAVARNLLFAFLNPSTVSLRQTQQAMHRLALVMASLDTNLLISPSAIAVMLILKTIDPNAYRKFIHSNITDKEVSTRVFDLPGMDIVKSDINGALFDALLIIAKYEFTIANQTPPGPVESSLYNHVLDSAANAKDSSTRTHAKQVVSQLEMLRAMFDEAKKGNSVGFNLATHGIELISTDLLG